ncbi:HAD family hydrolase [Treponema sp. R80B11-R83G3]
MKTTEKTFRPSAVIFDMDGLMFDTENLTIPLWEVAGKPFGYNITYNIVLRMVGISAEKARLVMYEEFGTDFPYDTIRGEFRRLVQEEVDKNGVPLKPGLMYLLDRLSAVKIPFALATSSRTATATNMLSKAGIIDRFTALTCGEEVTNGKPAPDIFLLAAEKLGQPPGVCVGFEDSPPGLLGLHAAGIRSIFIKDLIEPPPEILATVWHRCNDLKEAAELFGIAE